MDKCETCKGTYREDKFGVMVEGNCTCELPWNYLQGVNE